MTAEGSEKTWDQCRIKLKNLKSQYRYVKDRIPNIDDVDLEDDETLKQLIGECQGRGISPSNIKHLRYLRRFLQKTADYATNCQMKSSSGPLEVTISSVSSVAEASNPLSTSPRSASGASLRTSFISKLTEPEGMSIMM